MISLFNKFFKKSYDNIKDEVLYERNIENDINIKFLCNFKNFIFIEDVKRDIMKNERMKILEMIGKGKTGQVYKIIDNFTNDIFILKIIEETKLSFSYTKLDIFDDIIKRNVSYEYNKQYNEETGSYYVETFGSDNFTNQSLIHIILNKVLSGNKNFLYQYNLGYDGKKGYNITEFSNRLDLHQYLSKIDYISDSILYKMINQIVDVLFLLKTKQIGFNHSDLKTKNIFVSENNLDSVYYKIADFDKSSLFYNNIRFYNNTYNWRIGKLITTPFPLKLEEKYNYQYYCLYDTHFYENFGFHEYIMSNPHGFYESFDFYTFFYSLIVEPQINYYLLNNLESKIWKYYKFLFHFEEEKEWIKFLDDIQTNNYEQSICYFWNRFYYNKYKLRFDVSELKNMKL
jgi:serine/threonine protein kinase